MVSRRVLAHQVFTRVRRRRLSSLVEELADPRLRLRLRLRTLADVFTYAQAEGIEPRLAGVQVRRPPASRGGRRAFVSGKKKRDRN